MLQISFLLVVLCPFSAALLAEPLPPIPAESIGFNLDGSPSESLQLLDYEDEGSGKETNEDVIKETTMINKEEEERKQILLKSSKFKDISIPTVTTETQPEHQLEQSTVSVPSETTTKKTAIGSTTTLSEEDFATVTIALPEVVDSPPSTTELPPPVIIQTIRVPETAINNIETTEVANQKISIGKEGKEISFGTDEVIDTSKNDEDISPTVINELPLEQTTVTSTTRTEDPTEKRGPIARRRLRIKQHRIAEQKSQGKKKIHGDSKEIKMEKSSEVSTTFSPTSTTMLSSVRTTVTETSSQPSSTTTTPRRAKVESEVVATPLVLEEQRNQEDLAKAEQELQEVEKLRRNHLQGKQLFISCLTKRRRLRHKGEHGLRRTNGSPLSRKSIKIKVVPAMHRPKSVEMMLKQDLPGRLVDAHVMRIAVTVPPTERPPIISTPARRPHRKHRRGVSRAKHD